jgi:FkbM family methyltransferase
MKISPHDFMDQAMLFGYYEAALAHWIRSMVKPGEMVVDVGAHKGYITLLLSRAVGPHGTVLALEPDPNAATILQANLSYNRVGNVIQKSCLVGDKSGACDFFLSRQMGFSSRFPNEIAEPLISAKITAEMRTFDSLHASFDRLSFVKIDAEGSEPLILKGMQQSLSKFQPILWLEVNQLSLHVANQTDGAIEDQLIAAGYKIFRPIWRRDKFLRGTLTLNPLENLVSQSGCFDIIAIPQHLDLGELPPSTRISALTHPESKAQMDRPSPRQD